MQTTTQALWINGNGRVVCTDHGGHYLRTAVEATPGAPMIDTPLDNWMMVPAEMATCEEC